MRLYLSSFKVGEQAHLLSSMYGDGQVGYVANALEGLGLLDFAFMPHFRSQHSESHMIDQEIAYCEKHAIAYRTFRDGEVLIL